MLGLGTAFSWLGRRRLVRVEHSRLGWDLPRSWHGRRASRGLWPLAHCRGRLGLGLNSRGRQSGWNHLPNGTRASTWTSLRPNRSWLLLARSLGLLLWVLMLHLLRNGLVGSIVAVVCYCKVIGCVQTSELLGLRLCLRRPLRMSCSCLSHRLRSYSHWGSRSLLLNRLGLGRDSLPIARHLRSLLLVCLLASCILLLASASLDSDTLDRKRELLRLDTVIHSDLICLVETLSYELYIDAGTLGHRKVLHEADCSLLVTRQVASDLSEDHIEIFVALDVDCAALLLKGYLSQDKFAQKIGKGVLSG
mmetsp:Transcript_8136/g.9765  ORF Transcript_8136/g.9765 Transcript_8136/m.9765 type:complete len:306 (+) Transcript_8136:349-1266(+)